jgi:putative oxidoreductase
VPHVAEFDSLHALSLIGLAAVLEIAGSLLLLLGLFTRPVAFILSGEMAVAYFTAHAPQDHFFSPALNRGEEAVLYCFIFLFLSVAGGGAAARQSTISRGYRLTCLVEPLGSVCCACIRCIERWGGCDCGVGEVGRTRVVVMRP